MVWNGNKFSIYDSEEKTILKLLKSLGEQTNHNTDNKTDVLGDHLGSWQGMTKPTMSEQGLRATVESHIIEIDKLKKVNEKCITIEENETVHQAIARATTLKVNLELKPKRYNITTPIILDISRVRIIGNGAILDFSLAPADMECIKIISSATSPYILNGAFISELEMSGRGINSTQCCINFASTGLDAQATSHIDLKNLNVHDFNIGIKYTKYAYLIRHYSCDIYNCNVCVDMIENGADMGENFNFYGCAFYNSGIALRNRQDTGSFHFTSCSIDYVSYAFDLSETTRCTFINGHIEGGCKIKGSVNIIGTWLVLMNAENIFEGNINCLITIDKCFINTPTVNKNLCNGEVRVRITDCRYFSIDNFSTNKLNVQSSSTNPKFVDLYAIGGTSANTDKWSMGNCKITVVTTGQETGDRCIKVFKEYGTGSFSTFRLLIPRNKKSNKINLNIRMKSNVALSNLIATMSCVDFMGYDSNGVPLWLPNTISGSFNFTLNSNWATLTLNNNTNLITSNENFYAIDFNLFNAPNCEIYVDSVTLFEY